MNCRHCEAEIRETDLGYGKIDECRECAKEVDRYVGHMIWDHKTAPALEVHANSKSLAALRDGRQRSGGNLVYEVKERSRRRESDIDSLGSSPSLTPYIRPVTMNIYGNSEELPKIEMRHGSGKTVASYSRSSLEKISTGDQKYLQSFQGTKLLIAKSVSRLQLSNIAGWSITVWQDSFGYYVIPKKSVTRSVLDHETLRQIGYRTSNYRKI